MKYAKLIGLAAIAAMALMAFAGAGTASATRLCKAAEKTCSSANTYPKGTEIVASLEKETTAILRNTESSIVDTCTGSETKGKTENESGTSVSGPISSLTFTGCSNPTSVLKNGSLSVTNISGTNNGTVTAKESEVTISVFGTTCTFGAGGGTTLGTLTGGAMATMDIKAVVNLVAGSFLCPKTAVWEAKYTVTKPEPLFVTA
ncbi:MAG: hypothetical protein ACTHNP_10010 [Solirubrobacterales bacterium]